MRGESQSTDDATFSNKHSQQRIFLMSRSEKLTAALLADREHHATKQSRHNIIPCFSCGFKFLYRGQQTDLNGRFCSMRCQDWFDGGNPSYEQQREHERKLINAPLADLIVVTGPPGMVGRKSHAALFDAVAQSRRTRGKRKVKTHAQ
jgi:hypothetical protein